jgi:sulfate permease, SulP family
MLKPKLFSIVKHRNQELTKNQFGQDIISGIIVAVIALPLSVALGIASGVSPEKGLITAIIAGFFISFLGGSRVQIGGPTGAFVVIVYGIIEKYGIEGLIIATAMAGVILILMGFLKFGDMIKFIPCTITTGFTAGIAVVLFSTQIKDFLGLSIDKVPSEFIHKWSAYISNISTVRFQTVLIGLISLLLIVYWPKINKTIPGSLVALVVATLLVKLLGLPVETIGDRFGEISSAIPTPKFDLIDGATFVKLINPAITIAALAGIESLLSAVVADGMIGKKHNSNMELVAQGVANIASALFGGIPATGAIARTAANVRNGGRTPVAGVVHAITLLLIMLVFMPLAKLIPMTTLAAILIIVSYNMSDIKEFKSLLRATKSDVAVLLVTFLFTVVFDLVIAIAAGMIITMLLFVKKMSDSTMISCVVNDSKATEGISSSAEDNPPLVDDKILAYEVNGPLFFGAAQHLTEIVDKINLTTEVLIIRMNHAPIMDATAYDGLKKIYKECKKRNITLMFTEVQKQPLKLMHRMKFIEALGDNNFFEKYQDAVEVATDLLSETGEFSA